MPRRVAQEADVPKLVQLVGAPIVRVAAQARYHATLAGGRREEGPGPSRPEWTFEVEAKTNGRSGVPALVAKLEDVGDRVMPIGEVVGTA